MRRTLALLASVLVIASVARAADPPALVNYQGVLRDENDRPRKGTFDMVFRFWSADAGGVEILVDSHTAAGGNAVTVSGGLFNVQLGGGTVSDGSGAGVYTSLADVFRDYGTVWLAIRVAGEDLAPRVRIVSAPYALNATNAARLGGSPASSYLDTSATTQTKNGQIVVESATSYGVNAYGASAGGYFRDATNSGYAFVGSGDDGIAAYGDTRGGYFEDRNASGQASVGYADYGISARGNAAGGYFADPDGSGYAYVARNDYGIEAHGALAGGYFVDSTSSCYAYAGYGNYGIGAYGTTAGGHFEDTAESGWADVGNGNHGIRAYGTTAGGYFADSDGSGYASVGEGDYGIDAAGDSAGAYFRDTSGTSSARVASGSDGINASGSQMGGRFYDGDDTSYAYIAYGNDGILAYGNGGGGFFSDIDQSGWGRVAYADKGVLGRGDEMGGDFDDTDSSAYAYVGYSTYKIQGSGAVSFVQNHPEQADRVIVYAAPEGDEVAVYTRGTARLADGEARVALGPTFKWVTNPDIGLTAHLTPRGAWADLYVVAVSTSELVVRGAAGVKDAAFDYIVYGLRIGFEESSVVQEKTREAFIPAMTDHRARHAAHPELRGFDALERFRGMARAAGLAGSPEMAGAAALRAAIHEYDPAENGPPAQPERAVGPPPGAAVAPRATDASPSPAPPARRVDPRPDAAAADAVAGDARTLLPVAEPVDAGDLLALDPLRPGSLVRSRSALDPLVVAVASAPSEEVAGGTLQAPVFDTIYARVKADASTGAIRAGDLLVASALPGHAMKAPEGAPAAALVGKALEALEVGQGLVRIVVTAR